MKSREISLPVNKLNPFVQSAAISLLAILAMIISSIFHLADKVIWTITCSAIMLFSFVNPVISVFQPKWLPYFIRSCISLIVIILLLVKFSTWVAGSSLFSQRDYAMTLTAAIIFFFLANLLALLLKSLYGFASDN